MICLEQNFSITQIGISVQKTYFKWTPYLISHLTEVLLTTKQQLMCFQGICLHTQQPVIQPLEPHESLWTFCTITQIYQRP